MKCDMFIILFNGDGSMVYRLHQVRAIEFLDVV